MAAGRLALDHQRAKPFGGAVDGRSQARRAAADNDGIVFSKRDRGRQAQAAREFPSIRPDQQIAAVERDRGEAALDRGVSGNARFEQRIVGGNPFERYAVSIEEIAQRTTLGVVPVADDRRARRRLVRRDIVQPFDAFQREGADRCGNLRRRRGDGMKIARFDTHETCGRRRAKVRQNRRSEHDRNFAEKLAGYAMADDAFDTVDGPRHVRFAFEHHEEGGTLPFVRRVLAALQVNVGRAFCQPFELCVAELGKNRHGAYFLGSYHCRFLVRLARTRRFVLVS